jgi:conjugative transfer pilus assembly protein TraH
VSSFSKKILVAVMIGALELAPMLPARAALAGMTGMLTGMYTAMGTPGVYQTQNGEVLSGGYVAVRTAIINPNIIAFSPPNISAGCGGINAYFGSWSFISGAQLQQLITAIGQAAGPFLFQMAIESMCPQCMAILSKLEDTVQAANHALLSSCQLAAGIFNGDDAKLASHVADAATSMWSAATGAVPDANAALLGSSNADNDQPGFWSRMQTNIATTSVFGNASTANTPSEDTVAFAKPYGNMAWKGIVANQAEVKIAGDEDPYVAELLMSLIGTQIALPPGATGGPTPTPAASGANGNATGNSGGQGNAAQYPPAFGLKALVDGNPDTPVMQCLPFKDPNGTAHPAFSATGGAPLDPMACMNVTVDKTQTMGTLGYGGIKTMVQCLLYGSALAAGTPTSGAAGSSTAPSCAFWGSPNGLVSDVLSGTAPSPQEQALANMSPVPFLALMQRASANPALVNQIVAEAQPYLVAGIAVQFADIVIQAMNHVYQNNHGIFLVPPGLQARVAEISRERQAYDTQLIGAAQATNTLTTTVNNYLKSFAKPVSGNPGAAAK